MISKNVANYGYYLKKLKIFFFAYLPVSQDHLYLRTFVDSSFMNSGGQHTHLGYTVLLSDYLLCHSIKFHLAQYMSKESRIIVQSVLGEELYAFANAFNCTVFMKHSLEQMTSKFILLQALNVSKSLLDFNFKFSNTENRLMIAIHSVRKAYEPGKIFNNALVQSKEKKSS